MKVVKRNTRGYYGMNHEAGKELGIKDNPPKGTIYVNKELKGRMLKRTIAHEKFEVYLMEHNKDGYEKNHKRAMKFERNVR
jgi:hypothetical protein